MNRIECCKDLWTFFIQCILPLQVSQIGLYGGFIENYVKAVEVVRKCTHSDPRFRTLAEVLKILHHHSNI